eukprot:TRINITY_DN11768_c0_g2_i1.p1 TRINITY_DN11768_c0_g2~~TRINITY_DN11768_c0_g2_i1.p1  ORF type:complete len:239 (+),score=39.78 TRINITY_DN11768_c0_g2_i1:60-776(+)
MAHNLYVFDFDNTVVDGDTDLYVVKQVSAELYSELEARYAEEAKKENGLGWTEMMNWIAGRMHESGFQTDQLAAILATIPLHPHMSSALSKLKAADHTLRIVSDANTFYIDAVLKGYKLEHAFESIKTNPGEVQPNGRLKISPYLSTPHDCPVCKSAPNICKGNIVSPYLNEGHARVIYVGDGGNDLCPSLRLRKQDLVLARKGFKLSDKLSERADDVKADVRTWKTYQELHDYLLAA